MAEDDDDDDDDDYNNNNIFEGRSRRHEIFTPLNTTDNSLLVSTVRDKSRYSD
jgi:hypothetical protein